MDRTDELQGEEGSMDETERDATVREGTTADESPEEGDDSPVDRDVFSAAQQQERDDLAASAQLDHADDAETHTETPDSPELD